MSRAPKKHELPARILTERLELRPARASDFGAWLEAQRSMHPAMSRFDRGPVPERERTRAAFARRMRRLARMAELDFTYSLAVFERATGRWVGNVDLHPFVRGVFQWANLGYAFFNQHWGKGYAREASRAALEIAFRHLRLHRVEASTTLDNKASIGVAKGIGLRKECVRKGFMFEGGRWVDLVVFAANAEDFGFRVKPASEAGRDELRRHVRQRALATGRR